MLFFVLVTPVIKVFTEDPPEVGSGESTVATCIAACGKPAATITWKTSLAEQRIENNSFLHENGTTTTQSQLLAIPVKSMHQQEVFCIVEHPTLKHPEIISHKLNIYCEYWTILMQCDRSFVSDLAPVSSPKHFFFLSKIIFVNYSLWRMHAHIHMSVSNNVTPSILHILINFFTILTALI